ncbi:MAG: YHYH protein, partial [Candidatus Latescibacteria bacterium]|nr:YHYH protein [Candidatus Latescibacterota bacterium]
QPEFSASPLSTSSHLLKGAMAVGVNGIPIFNPLNNRGEDAKAFGELDDWGGHCGKADDYHYHIPPTHLQSAVGTGNPIAYALDGFPIYGSTTETLDVYPGKFNEDGSYQYHTIDAFPYFMAGMRGNVSLDPNTTAPEDQIIPQALSSPLRGGDYGPLNGAVNTSFTSTGTNAYSLQRQEVVRLIDGMKAEGRCEGVGTVIIPEVQAWPVACICIAAAVGTRVRFSNLRWGTLPSLTSFYTKFFSRLSRPHTSFTDIHWSFMVHPSLHSF